MKRCAFLAALVLSGCFPELDELCTTDEDCQNNGPGWFCSASNYCQRSETDGGDATNDGATSGDDGSGKDSLPSLDAGTETAPDAVIMDKDGTALGNDAMALDAVAIADGPTPDVRLNDAVVEDVILPRPDVHPPPYDSGVMDSSLPPDSLPPDSGCRPAVEVCDGEDNDCDGETDKGVRNACGGCGEVPREICDGEDNDCDGRTDEDLDCECRQDTQQSCYSGSDPNTEGVGVCRQGTQACEGGLWGFCEGEVVPSVEVCDGLDNDCDEYADNVPGFGVACAMPGQMGVCALGHLECNADGELVCFSDRITPSAEVCDGLDNDCDGATDEQCQPEIDAAVPPPDATALDASPDTTVERDATVPDVAVPDTEVRDAEQDQSIPDTGTVADVMVTDMAVPDAQVSDAACDSPGCITCNREEEVCDGLDNDCDRIIDNNVPGVDTACDTGLQGICRTGMTACGGEAGIICRQDQEATPEDCRDGADNDCDGETDEGNPPLVICVCTPLSEQTCYNGPLETQERGVCQDGVQTCSVTGTGYGECMGEVLPQEETCDREDNDCNGAVDDVLGVGMPCFAGQGACRNEGLTECGEAQTLRCSAEPLASSTDEVCDGVDSDCDGEIDEGPDGPLSEGCYEGPPATAGIGDCHNGVRTCVGGEWSACTGQVLPSTELCNSEDEDCDGAMDNGFDVEADCAEGLGICRAQGHRVCNPDGQTTRCDATPGEPQAEVCDGLDNDCEGDVDEGLLNACGQCGPTPREVCANQVDEDCDGVMDEADCAILIPRGQFYRSNGDVRMVDSYYVDQTSVTVAQYMTCVNAGVCTEGPPQESCNWGVPGRDNHPLNCVSLVQARTFCEWRGGHITTYDEFQKAWRGGCEMRGGAGCEAGVDDPRFPWGNAEPSEADRMCNRAHTFLCNPRSTVPVSNTMPNGNSVYGVGDMSGNLSKMVTQLPFAVNIDPSIGGGWRSSPPSCAVGVLVDERYAQNGNDSVGFMCAYPAQ